VRPWVAEAIVIRQAHSYLAGAVSGTALIASAIVAFVVLVSLQAVRDWPLANLGGGDTSGVSNARPVNSAQGAAGTAAGGAAGSRGRGAAAAKGNGGGPTSHPRRDSAALGNAPSSGEGGSANGAPASPGGGTAGGAPAAAGSTSPGSGGTGGGGGGGGGSGSSTSGAVTGAVNDTVSGADAATGGALGNAGVTGATEEIVNGVAGPESTPGKTVDKATETIGGLPGG